MRRISLIIIFSCLISAIPVSGQDACLWRFAVVGDTHVPQAYTLQKIIPSLIEEKIEVVLFTGDLIQGGKGQNTQGLHDELTTWKHLTEPLADNGIRILAVRGNHEADVKGNNIEPWHEIIGSELNLVHTYKNVTFVGMDNYLTGAHSIDTCWLEKTLKQIEKDQLIIPFGHEPAFSCDTFHPICLDADPETRDRFWELLETYGITHYFCGHTHQYNNSRITHGDKTIYQIVSGGGGGSLQPKRGGIHDAHGYKITPIALKSETGYLLVEVYDEEIKTEWIHISDQDVENRSLRPRKRVAQESKGSKNSL